MWDAPMPHGGDVQHYDSYTIIRNMGKLFDEHFIHLLKEDTAMSKNGIEQK